MTKEKTAALKKRRDAATASLKKANASIKRATGALRLAHAKRGAAEAALAVIAAETGK